MRDALEGAMSPSMRRVLLRARDGVATGPDVTLRAMARRGWVQRGNPRVPWRLTPAGWALREALEDRAETVRLLRDAHTILQMDPQPQCHKARLLNTISPNLRAGDPCPHCAWLRRFAKWKLQYG